MKKVFMEKSCRKCAPKASPRLLFYFGCKIMLARNSFKNKIFSKGIIKNLFQGYFSFEPTAF